MAIERPDASVNMVTLIQHAMDDWRRSNDPASDDGPTMAEAIADALVLCPDHAPGDVVTLGRNQFDLLRDALEGLLKLLVDDWEADAPIAKNPWSTDERFGPLVQPQEVWNAVDQARGVLGASSQWRDGGRDRGE